MEEQADFLKEDLIRFGKELCKFYEMMKDHSLTENDYYDAFIKMCYNYNEHSIIPYSVLHELIFSDKIPMESYYLEAFMYVYGMHDVSNTFLEDFQKILEIGCNEKYIENSREKIKKYVKDGYVIAYRGEFAVLNIGNLDYRQSVSYSLDYEQAKRFATRFNDFSDIKKSVIHTVKVPINDVVAYIEREDEVVCIPISIGGKMELIKTDDMLKEQ